MRYTGLNKVTGRCNQYPQVSNLVSNPVKAHLCKCVPNQIARAAEYAVAMQTHGGLLPGVSPHVALQVVACTEAPHALAVREEFELKCFTHWSHL